MTSNRRSGDTGRGTGTGLAGFGLGGSRAASGPRARVSLWRTIVLAMVVVIGGIYAAPNLFPPRLRAAGHGGQLVAYVRRLPARGTCRRLGGGWRVGGRQGANRGRRPAARRRCGGAVARQRAAARLPEPARRGAPVRSGPQPRLDHARVAQGHRRRTDGLGARPQGRRALRAAGGHAGGAGQAPVRRGRENQGHAARGTRSLPEHGERGTGRHDPHGFRHRAASRPRRGDHRGGSSASPTTCSPRPTWTAGPASRSRCRRPRSTRSSPMPSSRT